MARGAGFLDGFALAAAIGAGLLHAEKALAHLNHAAAAAVRAGFGAGAGLGAAAVAVAAFFPARDAKLRHFARSGFFQRDFHRVAQIGATEGALRVARAGARKKVTKNAAKSLGKIVGVEFGAAAKTAATSALPHAGVPELVVGGALLRVGKHVVGFGDFLELFFGGLGIVAVAVRVVFHRQLAIGFFNVVGAGVPGHAQDFIVIAFGHDSGSQWKKGSAGKTRAARAARVWSA